MTWHLQLPARPEIDCRPLKTARQLRSVDEESGIWEMTPDQRWLNVTQDHGRLFVQSLLPAGAQRRVVGGPMKRRSIPDGSSAGRAYSGGEPFGYEHRLWSASFLSAPNAAYRLGCPTGLGPQFGVGATWGRLDVSPAEKTQQTVFLHLLIPTDAIVEEAPSTNFEGTVRFESCCPSCSLQRSWPACDLKSPRLKAVWAQPVAAIATIKTKRTKYLMVSSPSWPALRGKYTPGARSVKRIPDVLAQKIKDRPTTNCSVEASNQSTSPSGNPPESSVKSPGIGSST